ncbi:MAG TPA: DUF2796 domain-containing protein [Caldimonas sp.]|jgi:hypothetical protein|nr:DUF2796 domain-containing protein [Caldimonas sp.]HEX2540310.1 DUF2796 domain-containing protein [Caldimonas sp.]
MHRFLCSAAAQVAAFVLCGVAGADLSFAQTPPAAGKSAARSGAHAHAHAHGVARLNVTVQDGTVTLALESPIDNFVGFERRPRTDAEKAALEALQARMRSPAALFQFDAGAACALVRAEAESALFRPAGADAAGARGAEHVDLDASFEYRCSAPGGLSRLDLGLFEAYPRLQRLDVVVAGPGGQLKRTLRRPDRSVSLRR